jgi:hypothetical protein
LGASEAGRAEIVFEPPKEVPVAGAPLVSPAYPARLEKSWRSKILLESHEVVRPEWIRDR